MGTFAACHSFLRAQPLRHLIGALLLLCVLLVPSLAFAEAGAQPAGRFAAWVIESASGSVSYFSYGEGGPSAGTAEPGLALSAPARLRTGADGRAVVTNGHDRIALSSSSEIQFPSKAAGPDDVVIIQYRGTARYDVESRRKNQERSAGLLGGFFQALFDSGVGQAFEVHTPYLTAAVKGTSFTVELASAAGAVEVLEGVVEVSPREGGSAARLVAGQKAKVLERTPAEVSVIQSASLAPLDQTPASRTATTGLESQASATLGTAGSTLDATTQSLGNTLEGTLDTTGQAVGSLGSTVDRTLDTTVGALGGLLGGDTSDSDGSSGGDASGGSSGDSSGGESAGGSSGDSSGGESAGGSSGSDSPGGGSDDDDSGGGLGDAVGDAVGGVRDALGGLL